MQTPPRISSLIASVVLTATATAAPQYQIFDLGVVQTGDTASQGLGVSPGGIAVGRSFRSGGAQAFSWTPELGIVGLPNLAGRSFAVANSSNASSFVVGTAATTAFGSDRLPVRWNNGVVSQIALPPGETLGEANDLGSGGITVGSVNVGSSQRGVIYDTNADTASIITQTTPGGSFFVTAFRINFSGRIVGQGVDPNNAARNVGIVYDRGSAQAFEVGALPGFNGALAFGVSPAGHVVGSSMLNQGSGLPFIWTEANGIVPIPLPAGTSSGTARAVNSAGWAVGIASSAFAIPFLYDGTNTYRLADLLPPGSGWDLSTNTSSSALGISDNAMIVGTGVLNGETHGYAMIPLKIAFIKDPQTFESVGEVYTMNEDGANLKRLTATGGHSGFNNEPKWSPDGTRFAFTRAPFIMIPPHPGPNFIALLNSRVGGGNLPLTGPSTEDSEAAWSPGGTKIAFTSLRDGNQEIYLMDADGANQVRLTYTGSSSQAAWSPDGLKIAFTTQGQIFAMDPNGANTVNLTNNPGSAADWSPDGSKIAFESTRDGNSEIYVMDANGSNQVRLTNNSVSDSDPTWSPDGTRIAFTTFRDGNSEIYVMDADGSNPTNLTNDPRPDSKPDWQRRISTLVIPTPTPPPTPTPTPTPTLTPSPTPPSPTPTPSDTIPPSPPPTATPTVTPSPTPTPPATPTPTATPSATPSSTPAAQPLNVSTRLRVQTGDNAGIAGFIITGTAPKNVLLRGIGPSLTAFGVPGALANPTLDLRRPDGTRIRANNDWQEDPAQAAAIQATGLAPQNDLEAAIVETLDPGSYTVILRGMGMTAGVGLAEVYDLNQGVDSKLANLSTRAFVDTGDNIVIAGFVLGGSNGNDRAVVRGIGPSLTAFGVANALADPTLELRDNNGALLASNNDWQDNPGQAAELTAAGLAPTNPLESAIAISLPPGPYTALLAGRNNGTGVGVVEVYDRGAP
jgi:Tol biopolymer transport system component